MNLIGNRIYTDSPEKDYLIFFSEVTGIEPVTPKKSSPRLIIIYTVDRKALKKKVKVNKKFVFY